MLMCRNKFISFLKTIFLFLKLFLLAQRLQELVCHVDTWRGEYGQNSNDSHLFRPKLSL